MATVQVIIEGSDLNEIEEVMVNFVNKNNTAEPDKKEEKKDPLGF